MTDHVRLIAFDLDDTLAPSKSPMPERMGRALTSLLDAVPVCIISGGHFGQFRDQVLAHLSASDDQLSRLHLMPTCGTRYLRHSGGDWQQVYAHDLTRAERAEALAALEGEARRLHLWEEETWGDILEDRGSQITFSALGQAAPLAAKKAWDPTGEKKEMLRDAVARLLPALEVRSGGSTSVDITRAGVDKAYGMVRLSEQTGIDLVDMLFVGDRLDEGGNDYPVKRLGIPTRAVEDWRETADLVERIVASFAGTRA
ncbi:HAD-IIB family hydrolase [Georgenia sp. SUBG003]|uniref:HAD-IIB family hydrolase n=1 Tax=Georgenia sp. SUBG003 TaxID=1497974 RepID=UPI0004DAE3D8|nr:HAD family hydrolase [Georgenia sp. SUBG003]